MSLVSKDSVIKNCADAYRQGIGSSELVKVGELPNLILEAISSNAVPAGVEIGEFTPVGGTGDFTVAHNLGVKPKYVFGWIVNNYDNTNYICLSFSKANISEQGINEVTYLNSSGILASETTNASVEDDANLFCVPKMPTGAGMIPLYRYKYIAII